VGLQLGFGLTVSTPQQGWLEQPTASVTVKQYVPALLACALAKVIVQPVPDVPLGPVQVQVYGPVPPDGISVNVAEAPAHTAVLVALHVGGAWHWIVVEHGAAV
jgi:hypothetical protein